jgi:glycosyltransferase involved in cell wall biosynthesis
MISVITCTYNTPPDVLARTWASLKNQTFTNWEWVIYDDSPSMDTYNQVYGFCSDERYKIRLYRPHVPSGGNIGYVKHAAFMLGLGEILVELDHDDELTPDALAEIQAAFELDVGFVYSDCCELFANGGSGKYPEGWAFGYGSEHWDAENNIWVMHAPPLNRVTLSHIVSVPNHVRAWRADAYRALDGHDPSLPVADDYDLIVRTVLAYPAHAICKMLYKQHIGSHTAQRKQNALIQQLVPQIHAKYSSLLDAKFGPLPEPRINSSLDV